MNNRRGGKGSIGGGGWSVQLSIVGQNAVACVCVREDSRIINSLYRLSMFYNATCIMLVSWCNYSYSI